ncbi:MAG: hypothetical protein COV46_02160 [Deltaproteobacteria bacterium CG11_big_fil_rev_8_21_14_0_20_49_13]|nr:MAG: hypothetical protein COV46_02160 [Deltaproteobacteria bacterium CG11_big_fil_rev_8_21_14_0_20_49_13]
MKKFSKEELIKIFEVLIESECPLHTRPEFRKHYDRDGQLVINQLTRKATGNVAYRSVDFDVKSVSDAEFWNKIEGSKHLDLLEDNAAAAILGMAEKFGILN